MEKSKINMLPQKRNKNYNNLYFIAFLFSLKFFLITSIFEKSIRNLYNGNSEIHFKIQGKGEQNLLSNNFSIIETFEVIVNEIPKNNCTKRCYLDREKNQITLRFKEPIESCKNMFYGLTNIV